MLSAGKPVAQLAATIGREFSRALLEELSDLSAGAVGEGLSQLVEARIVVPADDPNGDGYAFRHALLQDAAYQSQLGSQQRKAHARLVALLEDRRPERDIPSDLLAHHCDRAGLYDQAAMHYHAAGALASARYANHEAEANLRAALTALTRLSADRSRAERELSLLLAMAPPLTALRGFGHPEVGQLYDRIEALCRQLGEDVPQLPALLALARYRQRRAELIDAEEVGRSVLRIAKSAEIPVLEVIARLIIGSGEVTIARAADAIRDLERTLEIASAIDLPPPTSPLEPDLHCFIHTTLGIALASGGFPKRGFEQASLARARALELQHDPTIVAVLALSTINLTLLEDFETTVAWAEHSIELARGRGFHNAEAEARANLGWAKVALGDPSGVEDAEAGLAKAVESGFKGGMVQYLMAAANANALAGDYARAHVLLDRAHETYSVTGENICFEGRTRRIRATTWVAQGEPERAEPEFAARARSARTLWGAPRVPDGAHGAAAVGARTPGRAAGPGGAGALLRTAGRRGRLSPDRRGARAARRDLSATAATPPHAGAAARDQPAASFRSKTCRATIMPSIARGNPP